MMGSACIAVCCSVLQCVAVCCSVLQCVAVCCSVLQCVALCTHVSSIIVLPHKYMHCNTLQLISQYTFFHIYTHCNTLQHAATYCNTLQRTAITILFSLVKVGLFMSLFPHTFVCLIDPYQHKRAQILQKSPHLPQKSPHILQKMCVLSIHVNTGNTHVNVLK